MGKNVNKWSQKLIDHAKKSAPDVRKTASKRAIQKTAEGIVSLIGNKNADKITQKFSKITQNLLKVSRTSPKNNLETNKKEILRERYISPELRDKIIDDLRLKKNNYWKNFSRSKINRMI